MHSNISTASVCLAVWIFSVEASVADIATKGRDGIDATTLMLTGSGIGIGMVEPGRPGKEGVDDAMHFDMTIDPAEVFVGTAAPMQNQGVDDHGEHIAGTMIGTDLIVEGVSPEANLYASAVASGAFQVQDAIALQHIATRQSGDVRAINMSYGLDLPSESLDGSSTITKFLDWSSRVHDTLYIQSADAVADTLVSAPFPKDDYNGLTVGYSVKVDDVFRQVGDDNFYGNDASGIRTSVDLLAPGENVTVLNPDGEYRSVTGTSIAAPHATGTVALLQEHAEEQIMNVGGPQWKPSPNANAHRHQVMKAVLMNSADKLEDNGDGMRLGMTRTVLKKDGTSTWLDSDAYNPTTQITNADSIPLDIEMGTGHLNARRALQQFSPGEYDATVPTGTTVPQIGWDYANVNDTGSFSNEYEFADPLPAGSFVSITLAWDRLLSLDTDTGTMGAYDPGDTFEVAGDFDEGFNDLDIYLLPQGAVDITEAIARSNSLSNLEHLFFQIPTTGMYEFWVYEFAGHVSLEDTDYAVAWWAFNGPTGPGMTGDYTGDSVVDINDYNAWRSSFGSTTDLDADGNDDQVINAADYVIWRDNLGAGSGSGTLAAVPEPSAVMLLITAGVVFRWRRPRRERAAS